MLEYRLRNEEGLYLSYMRSPVRGFQQPQEPRQPTFNKSGKVWKTKKDALDELARYNFYALETDQTFPTLKLETQRVIVEAVEDDPTPDLTQLLKFFKAVNKTLPANNSAEYTPLGRAAYRLTTQGEPFRYLLVCQGYAGKVQGIEGRVVRHAFGKPKGDEPSVYTVRDSDTDLLYAKMALSEIATAIWDFKRCKRIELRTS